MAVCKNIVNAKIAVYKMNCVQKYYRFESYVYGSTVVKKIIGKDQHVFVLHGVS